MASVPSLYAPCDFSQDPLTPAVPACDGAHVVPAAQAPAWTDGLASRDAQPVAASILPLVKRSGHGASSIPVGKNILAEDSNGVLWTRMESSGLEWSPLDSIYAGAAILH